MEIRLIKNFTKGKYRAVNNNLMLQLVDGNKVFDNFTSKRIFLFNPFKNVHAEIMPEIAKFDVFKIYHGIKNKNFFIFSSFKMRSETEVQIEYYCYRISDLTCRLIHVDTVSIETIRMKDSIKIFALTQDFCMFQKYDCESGRYDIVLKDITDDKGVKLTNEQLVNEGLDCIIPLGGNKCCFKVGSSVIGIVNVNQFVSDMILNLPMVFTDVLDKSSGDVSFTDMYENNNNIIYIRKFPDSNIDEIAIYDYVNNIKKVRQNDNSLINFDYRRISIMGGIPYIYFADDAGTHFVNLNSQREDYLVPPEYRVEYIFGEYIITSRNAGFTAFSNKNKRIIEVFKVPDIIHHIYKKRGTYNGYVVLDEDLLLFVG